MVEELFVEVLVEFWCCCCWGKVFDVNLGEWLIFCGIGVIVCDKGEFVKSNNCLWE